MTHLSEIEKPLREQHDRSAIADAVRAGLVKAQWSKKRRNVRLSVPRDSARIVVYWPRSGLAHWPNKTERLTRRLAGVEILLRQPMLFLPLLRTGDDDGEGNAGGHA